MAGLYREESWEKGSETRGLEVRRAEEPELLTDSWDAESLAAGIYFERLIGTSVDICPEFL